MLTENKIYITASELASLLGVSTGHAYKIIKKMNDDLKNNGYLVISGKVPKKYFEKQWFGLTQEVI